MFLNLQLLVYVIHSGAKKKKINSDSVLRSNEFTGNVPEWNRSCCEETLYKFWSR